MIVVREERKGEATSIDAVVTAAFGRRDEARLVGALRTYTKEFRSFVLEDNGELIASAVVTPVTVDGCLTVCGLGLAPVAVSPQHQGRGVGTALVRHALQRSLGGAFVFAVVLGSPTYYGRFGFKPASGFGLSGGFGAPEEAFQAMEAWPKALDACTGMVRYAPEFSLVLG